MFFMTATIQIFRESKQPEILVISKSFGPWGNLFQGNHLEILKFNSSFWILTHQLVAEPQPHHGSHFSSSSSFHMFQWRRHLRGSRWSGWRLCWLSSTWSRRTTCHLELPQYQHMWHVVVVWGKKIKLYTPDMMPFFTYFTHFHWLQGFYTWVIMTGKFSHQPISLHHWLSLHFLQLVTVFIREVTRDPIQEAY